MALEDRLQKRMYFLLGCVRHALGRYDLVDLECDLQCKNHKKYDFARYFRRKYIKCSKMRPGYGKSEPKGAKSEPKASQS